MTRNYLERLTGRDPNLRAGDADREQTADRLRQAHTEGRLDLAEFQERLERCYASRTIGELSELVSDLPRQEDRSESPSLASFRPWRLAPIGLILIALILISTVSGHHHHVSWLWIPFVFIIWRMTWWRRLARGRRGPGSWI